MCAASSSQVGGEAPQASAHALGRVLRARGLDGGLLVALHGDDPTNLLEAREVLLRGAPGEVPFRVRRAEPAGRERDGRARAALWLEGLFDRDRAEHWSGAEVCVSGLPEPAEGEWYWRDLLGSRCLAPDGTEIGTLEEIWPTPGHDVLVVRDGSATRLVPAVEAVLLRFDPERRELWLDPPVEETPA